MKNYLKISFFLIVAIFTFKNCEKNEDIEIQEERKIEFQSVSKNTAKSVFDSFVSKQAKDHEELFGKSKGLTILPDWESFKQEELNFTDALLTTINIEINAITSLKPRLIFLNIDGKVLRAIETKNLKETKDDKIENGAVYYHNLDGKFVVGFKVENGIVTKKLVSKKKTNQANFLSFFTFLSNECDEDLDEESTFCDNELDEVVIRAVRTEASPVYHLSYGGSSGDYSPYGMVVETGGGGSRNGNRNDTNDRRCSGGRVYNYINGTCECREGYIWENNICIEEIVLESPDRPIKNMEDYLKCLDKTKGATITIYAQQPNPNNPSAPITKSNTVGHAFITISQGEHRLSYGFYPESGIGYFNATAGIMGRNDNEKYHVSVTNSVSSSSLKKLIKLSLDYDTADYELQVQNCTNFAISSAIIIGLDINKSECMGNYGIGRGFTPGKFGAHLKNINLPRGAKRNKNSGISPSNKECK